MLPCRIDLYEIKARPLAVCGRRLRAVPRPPGRLATVGFPGQHHKVDPWLTSVFDDAVELIGEDPRQRTVTSSCQHGPDGGIRNMALDRESPPQRPSRP